MVVPEASARATEHHFPRQSVFDGQRLGPQYPEHSNTDHYEDLGPSVSGPPSPEYGAAVRTIHRSSSPHEREVVSTPPTSTTTDSHTQASSQASSDLRKPRGGGLARLKHQLQHHERKAIYHADIVERIYRDIEVYHKTGVNPYQKAQSQKTLKRRGGKASADTRRADDRENTPPRDSPKKNHTLTIDQASQTPEKHDLRHVIDANQRKRTVPDNKTPIKDPSNKATRLYASAVQSPLKSIENVGQTSIDADAVDVTRGTATKADFEKIVSGNEQAARPGKFERHADTRDNESDDE